MRTMTRRRMTDPTTGKRATASGDETGPMSHASIAASECHPAATDGDSVVMPIERPHTENGQGNPHEGVTHLIGNFFPIRKMAGNPHEGVTPTNTKRHTTVTACEHCGDAFTPRRPHGRFCSSYCRRLAWLGRNPAKAAELAERDRQRLREHVIGCGGEWREDARRE